MEILTLLSLWQTCDVNRTINDFLWLERFSFRFCAKNKIGKFDVIWDAQSFWLAGCGKNIFYLHQLPEVRPKIVLFSGSYNTSFHGFFSGIRCIRGLYCWLGILLVSGASFAIFFVFYFLFLTFANTFLFEWTQSSSAVEKKDEKCEINTQKNPTIFLRRLIDWNHKIITLPLWKLQFKNLW